MTRRAIVTACAIAALVGFGHAAATTPDAPAVQCFEDGSCDNGYCEPLQLCDDSRDVR